MRRRGRIFKDFKSIKSDDSTTRVLEKINENLKLILELLCDLRVNTSFKIKTEKPNDS